ncbi:MAG: hypothetical protein HC916_02775 [Coleofasciculaceae cyanobacterium SM2_1_6]|nr:hypothetical protein [Coleofasciculaceae cyanobacterium SM2_1_6]
MTSINIQLGDAFLLETPPNYQHLYIAIAKTSDTNYLFVNLTKRRDNSEATCILQPNTAGMPSYVKAESVIAYQFARELDASQLALDICEGSRIPKCCFPADILLKIQQGGIASKRLPKIYKKALKRFLGVI